MNSYFDEYKSLESIIYVSHKSGDLIHIENILYFADKFHLQKYGRLITGDSYIAMKNGPVPSGAYDIIKVVRGDGFAIFDFDPRIAFSVEYSTKLIPLRTTNLDYLSDSEIECLDVAIEKYAKLNVWELWEIVREEPAFMHASENEEISFTSLVSQLNNSDQIFDYLNS